MESNMKKIFLILLVIFLTQILHAQENVKVILSGDYPDPTIMREGEDYYMTHSPFFYKPGFLIWHSRDLVNWEPICRALPEYEGSAMAPDLLKYKDKYYIYYPTTEAEIFVITADNIRGPWSKPVKLNMDIKEIDPGHIVGEDGHRYLFTSSGYVTPLSEDGLRVTGKSEKVYDGWDYPRQWKTEGKFLESPKLIFKDGYYYMTSAEGGTAGPATSHMCIMARSKSIFGPWENSPYNPLVHTFSPVESWWSKGHGTLIDDVNGNWWMVYHAYANSYHTLGRQTLLEPIQYLADGWFTIAEKAEYLPGDENIRHGFDLNDDFEDPELDLQWTFWKENTMKDLIIKNHTLQMKGKGTSPADGRLLLITPEDKCYETQVEVQAGKGNKAGMMLFYNENAFAGVMSEGNNFIVYKDVERIETIPNNIGSKFKVKFLNRGNRVTMQVGKDDGNWTTLVENLDVSFMEHNKYRGFLALRVGLLSAGEGQAEFKEFRYKNGLPQEKDMAAYLLAYHLDETHSLHFALSRDGYTFTALNDNKPVVAGDTIANQRGIRDPHIYRGTDGAFYLTMTDLHAKGMEAGFRNTETERDRKTYGPMNNRGIVMMKSWDLINWKHTAIRFDTLTAELKEMGCAWAPEVIYDEEKGKLMIHYAMRFRNEALRMYYVYVNDDFDRVETLPRLLFEYPEENIGVLDADIIKFNDKYHMFYAVNDGTAGGVKLAISDKINRKYMFNPRYYDFETAACEAPTVWKRIGEEKWVLMYDVSWLEPQNFGFAETSDFVNFTNLGHFNEGVMKATNFIPKHGTIIHLTAEEAEKLAKNWGLEMNFRTLE